ncbi:hypothetical protein LGM39_33825 [Burkholderia cepacia]|uniref:hypothetical protein n=1 Tax=Burkholderia cepacia TaxID=292 RepID=UPI001CF4ABFE|nr:hypothetical protein [Burkholderia cepacia]MCA7904353.1 hypothetical protein [Burkholderia cepacia]
MFHTYGQVPSSGAPAAVPQPPVVFAQFGGRIAPAWGLPDTLSYTPARHETRRNTAVAIVAVRGGLRADARGNQRQCGNGNGNGTIAQRAATLREQGDIRHGQGSERHRVRTLLVDRLAT